jgi:UDP-glucose 4-epimerase
LVNKEEKLRCRENKKFFIVPADNRSLNYDKFLSKGHQKIDIETEYNSNNTKKLKGDELEKVLLKLEVIKEELKANLIS